MRHVSQAKVLEITSYPPPRAGWGVRVQFVKHKLEQLGHDCQVLNIGKSRKQKNPEYVDVQSSWDYVRKVIWFSLRGYLVHMHMNGQSHKGVVLALLAEVINLLCGKRCVLTFHAGADQKFFPKQKSTVMAPILSLLFIIPKDIICNDPIMKQKISEYGIHPDKIHAIPAFSKQYLEFQQTDLATSLQHFMARSEPLLVSYLLIRPSFDIDTLLQAVKALTKERPHLGLVIMGANTVGDDMDPAAVTQLVQDLGLDQHVYWTGDLAHEHFLTVLSRASVFVRTHIYDGVSSSVLEALALNVPVVACENLHRPPEVLTFRTGQVSDLIAKIQQAWQRGDQACLSPKPPAIRDTVEEEAKLLVECAL
jgi:glycosyltransferase involved in cell wall biosynthesis